GPSGEPKLEATPHRENDPRTPTPRLPDRTDRSIEQSSMNGGDFRPRFSTRLGGRGHWVDMLGGALSKGQSHCGGARPILSGLICGGRHAISRRGQSVRIEGTDRREAGTVSSFGFEPQDDNPRFTE